MLCVQPHFRVANSRIHTHLWTDWRWNMDDALPTCVMHETQEAPALWKTLHEAFPIIHRKYRMLSGFMQSSLRQAEPLTCFFHFPVNWNVRAWRTLILHQLASFVDPSDEIVPPQFTQPLELKEPQLAARRFWRFMLCCLKHGTNRTSTSTPFATETS